MKSCRKQITATISLLDEGATVPFISRYLKEATDSLDEVEVAAIRDRVLAVTGFRQAS
nr:Tex-like N-terminal domain-containing protein [Pedobacter psychrodurus]